MSKTRPKVLFVGGFKEVSKDGSFGGQVYACRMLIHSKLKTKVDFILLDTTSDGVSRSFILIRALKSVIRFFKLSWFILFYQIDTVLVFCSSGLSFYEKGIMIWMSKRFGKQTILAPRSGLIIEQLQASAKMRHFGKMVFKSCDHVICQGSYWRNFFSGLYPELKDKMWVQLNWIELTDYPRKSNYNSNPVLKLLFIGQFHPYKGIQDLLEAMLLLKQKPIELTVYGDGVDRFAYEEFVKRTGLNQQVFFKGWANKEIKLLALSQSDVIVIPSHTEGFPNVILEAIASGVLVLSTQVGGIPEIVQDKTTGLLVKPSRPKEIADAIEWLLLNRNQLPVMAKEAYQKIEMECSLDKIVTRFEEKLFSK